MSGKSSDGTIPRLIAGMTTLALAACTGMQMKPYYVKELVQSLQVRQVDENELQISFYVQSESMYYPSGVNYEVDGRTMRVMIDRCMVEQPCPTMVRDMRTLSADEDLRVRLPYHGETVVLVHADAEQQIFP